MTAIIKIACGAASEETRSIPFPADAENSISACSFFLSKL